MRHAHDLDPVRARNLFVDVAIGDWVVASETWRIETKFSRYRNGNILHRINHADGRAVDVDDETAKLKTLLAEAMLDNAMLKDINAKKW